jgi:preprotein translocase subunit YajC
VDGGILVIVALFALFWLLLIRPQRRRQRAQNEMIASLEVGDEIVTAGGLYGEVMALDEDDVRVEIADGVEVRVARRAVAGVFREEEDDEEYEDEEEPGDEPEEELEEQAKEEAQPASDR